jgi:hypothetical protein
MKANTNSFKDKAAALFKDWENSIDIKRALSDNVGELFYRFQKSKIPEDIALFYVDTLIEYYKPDRHLAQMMYKNHKKVYQSEQDFIIQSIILIKRDVKKAFTDRYQSIPIDSKKKERKIQRDYVNSFPLVDLSQFPPLPEDMF